MLVTWREIDMVKEPGRIGGGWKILAMGVTVGRRECDVVEGKFACLSAHGESLLKPICIRCNVRYSR